MFLPLLLLFLIGFLVAAIRNSLSMLRQASGWRRWLILPSSALVVIGASGFFGQGIVASGPNWLPTSFEWPAGRVEDALTAANSYHIILVSGVARIQVYDRNWRFLRGWSVPRALRLRMLGDGTIEALTKSEKGLVFDVRGSLISERTYGIRESEDLENSLPHTGSVLVPTPASLYVFSNPLLCWFVFAACRLVYLITYSSNP